ncbi:hypothetical protein SS50377_26762 [Spironucleus salmonicida]|uniref:Uncharacterized protein n=1 Tax=Spironucleus salmonicida TaxID=348837 RepID=V6LZQ9_9EUKA|nr:hypothetical protein SS50377_26762 [Spironucleus salmonicida]|eukprot:EST49231.1 Hypothetical protein SS50377_10451 [Spironucleus salmonicida]
MFPIKYREFYSKPKGLAGKSILDAYFQDNYQLSQENFTSTNMFTVYELSKYQDCLQEANLKIDGMTDEEYQNLLDIRQIIPVFPTPYVSKLPLSKFMSNTPYSIGSLSFSPYNNIDYIMAMANTYEVSSKKFSRLTSKYNIQLIYNEANYRKLEQIHAVYQKFKRQRVPIMRKQQQNSFTEGLDLKNSLFMEWFNDFLDIPNIKNNQYKIKDIQQQIISMEVFQWTDNYLNIYDPQISFAIYVTKFQRNSIDFKSLKLLKSLNQGQKHVFQKIITPYTPITIPIAMGFSQCSEGIKLAISILLGDNGEDILYKVNQLQAFEQFWCLYSQVIE